MKDRENWAKPDKTILEHTEDLLNNVKLLYEYGYIKEIRIYQLCVQACKAHDLGKANPQFQRRIRAEKKIKFNSLEEVPHNILSGYMIDSKLFESPKDYLIVLHAVLYHHHYVDVTAYLEEEEALINKTLDSMEVNGKISRRVRKGLSGIIEENDAIRVKGLLHKCDYSASSGGVCEYPANFLVWQLSQFMDKLKEVDSHAKWNAMQNYCIEHQEENILVVAQTGMGKTEGGLNWIGNHKGFFVLPLRTAINAMYSRIRQDIMNNEHITERLAVLHSASLAYYIQQVQYLPNQETIELLDYEKNGKLWSMPLNITTMDQLFDFVFKYQGYELKLTTLAYSKIVIDEIQMYNPELLAYLIYGLERMYQLGGKMAIITATLPPFIEDLLYQKIDFNPKKVFLEDTMLRHHVHVKEEALNVYEICHQFRNNEEADQSNKILVICNTVKKAREVYTALGDELGVESVSLLHSAFIRKERNQLEDEIRAFGKTYNKARELDKRCGIWVSTSLVEASLDIDFDYLFTELQDLSSLFQRFGRCNRKGKKSVEAVNCFVYTEINPNILLHGNKGFIDERLYRLSREAIRGLQGVLKESEKMKLIENTFTTSALQGSDYLREYERIYGLIESIMPYKFEKSEVELRHIFSEEIIPKPVYEKHKLEIDTLVTQLNNFSLTPYEKISLEEQLMGYTVAIPQYEVRNYRIAVIKNKAEPGFSLKFGYRNEIQVVDCEYDKRGFVPKQYTLQSGEGEFL